MISVPAERVIYLRNDIALRAVIYLRHIMEKHANSEKLSNAEKNQALEPVFSMLSIPAERVIYLRNDIALRAVICLRHILERILYHITAASISYDLSYIILR